MKRTEAVDLALMDAFSMAEFERVFFYTFGLEVEKVVSTKGSFADLVMDALNWTERQGRLLELLWSARKRNPGNPELKAVIKMLGPDVPPYRERAFGVDQWKRLQGDVGEESLEKVLLANVKFQDVRVWLSRLGALFGTVCRVEPQPIAQTKVGYGSGFLVADDVIMTNAHVVRDFENKPLADVRIRFDYAVDAQGVVLDEGRTAKLAAKWDILRGPAGILDFALVRLDQPVAKDVVDGKVRGTIPLSTPPVGTDDPLLILQHPDAAPLKLSLGTIGGNLPGGQLSHNANTLGGSSGSPCLTTNLDAFAIHRATQGQNIAVGFDAIRTFLHQPENAAILAEANLGALLV